MSVPLVVRLIWFGFYFLFIAFIISVPGVCLRAKNAQLLNGIQQNRMRSICIQFARTNAIILFDLNLLSLMQFTWNEEKKLHNPRQVKWTQNKYLIFAKQSKTKTKKLHKL